MRHFPMIVVERPHQLPAKAWIAHSSDDVYAALGDELFTLPDDADVETAFEVLGDDLSMLTLLESEEEARQYMARSSREAGHNPGFAAVAECARELEWIGE